jgi:hypothetical protein
MLTGNPLIVKPHRVTVSARLQDLEDQIVLWPDH